MQEFRGAWPALITPFDNGGAVNAPVLRRLVDYLLEQGVDGFYITGSTGEGVYIPTAQRKIAVATVVEQVNSRVPVIAHIGSMVTADAVELAQHARDAGADAVSSIIPPQYTRLESIEAYYAEIASAVPSTPVLAYILGAPVNAVTFMQRLREIDNVTGAKYTGPNMYEFRQIVEMGDESRLGGWSIFSGMDEQCVFAALFGSCGNIGSTLNYMPRTYKAIHAAVAAGDCLKARDLQLQANKVTEVMINAGFMSALHAVMDRLGFPTGGPRLPNLALTKMQQDALFARLDAVGFGG